MSVVQSAPWVRDRTASVGPGARVGVDATPVGTSLGMASGCARPREVEAVVDVDGAGLVLCQSQSHGGCDPDGPRPGWAWAWARAGEHHHRQDRRRSRTGPGASRLRSSGDGACGTRPRACTRSRSKCSSIALRAILASRGDKIPPCGAPDLVPLTSPFPCEDSCVQEGLDQAKNPFIAGCVGAPGSSGPCGAVPLEARCDIGPRRTHS